jgi:hypothetical protein
MRSALAVLGKRSEKRFGGFIYLMRLIAESPQSISKREALGFC